MIEIKKILKKILEEFQQNREFSSLHRVKLLSKLIYYLELIGE